MADIELDAGKAFPVVIEKWQQMKNGTGSLTDTLVTRVTAWANIQNKGKNRSFEHGQLKQPQSLDLVVRHKGLDARDITIKWKVVYHGLRYSVINIINSQKKHTDFLLTIEAK